MRPRLISDEHNKESLRLGELKHDLNIIIDLLALFTTRSANLL